jgi:hypothetical protein
MEREKSESDHSREQREREKNDSMHGERVLFVTDGSFVLLQRKIRKLIVDSHGLDACQPSALRLVRERYRHHSGTECQNSLTYCCFSLVSPEA